MTDTPSRAELVRRAGALIPRLAANALWQEENRRLAEDTVQAMSETGLLRMRTPVRFGGYEADARTVTEVLAELSRGDGSAGWTAAVWAISAHMTGLFPEDVLKRVFADPDVRISGILSPGAMVTPSGDGWLVNGRWSFNTGAQLSTWNINAAVRPTADGGHEPVTVLLPMADLQIVDDWFTSGLSGSGSITTVADNVFVPAGQVQPMVPILQGEHPRQQDPGSPMWYGPFMPIACATVGAVALGLARAARDAFFARLPDRKITYTSYQSQAEAPLTHRQVAEAAVLIDEAEFHQYRAADLIDAKAREGRPWTLEERLRARLDVGVVTGRAKEAVDIYSTASGGSSIHRDVPIQRIARDTHALSLHAIMHPDTNLELYGRHLCGLAPNTQYL